MGAQHPIFCGVSSIYPALGDNGIISTSFEEHTCMASRHLHPSPPPRTPCALFKTFLLSCPFYSLPYPTSALPPFVPLCFLAWHVAWHAFLHTHALAAHCMAEKLPPPSLSLSHALCLAACENRTGRAEGRADRHGVAGQW